MVHQNIVTSFFDANFIFGPAVYVGTMLIMAETVLLLLSVINV